jgi:hypothetical protein
LRIASGPRAGEFVGLNDNAFTIGDAPECNLQLATTHLPRLQGVMVNVARDAEGWKVSANRSTVLVNQQPVEQGALVRSGDMIRLSPLGPDVQFIVQTQNQKRLDRLIATYLPQRHRLMQKGRAAAPAPSPPQNSPRPPAMSGPQPPADRPARIGAGPQPGVAPSRPPTVKADAPAPPGSQKLNSGGLVERWNRYYAANKNQANWIILGTGIAIMAAVIALFPTGSSKPNAESAPGQSPAPDSEQTEARPVNGPTDISNAKGPTS